VQIDGVCYPLVQDVHFEVGVAWTTTPESIDDLLFVAGLSSKHLDEPFQTEDGQYRFVGEIVSATRFDPSLPAVKLLIVYDRTKNGPVDYASLANSTKEVVREHVSDIFGAVQRQLQHLPNELTERWTFAPGDRFQHTAATINSGYAYVGGLGPTVRAIDTTTGTVEYTYDRDGSLVDSTPVVDSGVVVVGGGDGSIYGLDATDLSERWRYETGSAVVSSPTVAGGVVYVGNNRGEVYALDRDDGTLNWKTTLDSTILSDPIVSGTKLYVVSDGGILFALGTGGGLERWRYEITGDTGTVGSLVTAMGVYVANERLHSLSKTGSSTWSFELNGAATSQPTAWNGRIYVGTDRGTVHAVDAATGNQTWSKDVGNGQRTTVYAENRLLFVTNGGFTQVRDTLSGSTLAEVPVGGDVYASPTIRNETVYVLAGDHLVTLNLVTELGASAGSTDPSNDRFNQEF
jgi:outer membrane protein assembly factor BamB